MTKVNPTMVTMARDSHGLSQAALADLAGINQGFLSKVENGLADMSPETVSRIASVLRVPDELFYLTDPVAGPGVGCHYRRRQSATIGKLRELQARMNLARIRMERLLRDIEVDFPNECVAMDIDEYDDWPEQVAALLRRMWHVPYGPISNLTELIESAGGLIVREPFGTDKVDEMTQWLKGHQPFFFLNAEVPSDRYRWSLAHGLGHVIMHSIPGPAKKMEEEADRFAGEFLAPAAEIGPDLENLSMPALAQLKMRWKISMQAVVMRAFHLGAITERQRQRFFVRLSQAGYRKQEPYPLPQEEPKMLDRLFAAYRTERGYSVEELAKVGFWLVPEFRRLYVAERQPPPEDGPRLRLVN